jgi:hypothetical protein
MTNNTDEKNAVDEAVEDHQLSKINDVINDLRNNYDSDLVFEALMVAYFQYRNYKIGQHYEEETVRLKEELAKENADDEMSSEILEQIQRNDRAGEYSTTDEMK